MVPGIAQRRPINKGPMRGLVYYRINRDDIANVGVLKKCLSQVASFEKQGVQIDLVILSDQGILWNEQLIYSFSKPTLSKPITKYWFYFFKLLPYVTKSIHLEQYDFIYFRYALSHPSLIRFLQTAKKQYPSIKIMAEMPTYPYEEEKVTLVDRLSLFMDQYYRKKLPRYLDAFTHYGKEATIFKVPTIPITNGVTVHKIKVSTSQPKKQVIRLIALANWSFWHGLDRLIEGLNIYYSNKNPATKITLKIIGHGKAIPQYRQLVKSFNLEKVVEFFPPLTNKQLDEQFDQADIGIGTLGIHRKNIAIDSSLKHREYCARGIPFLLAGTDLDFPSKLPFILKCEPTDQPIDLERMIIFWESLRKEKVGKRSIRAYAVSHLDWTLRIKKVIDFILG